MVQDISGRAQEICLPYFNLVLIQEQGKRENIKRNGRERGY